MSVTGLLGAAGSVLGNVAGNEISSIYNENAADRAQERQYDMFQKMAEYNNPKNQVERLKKAGLSVGLMYGQAGTTGTQQAISAPQAHISGNTGLTEGAINAMMAEKNLQLLDSQINKNNAEATKLSGIDTELGIVNKKKIELENNYQEIQNQITNATKDTVIDTYSQALQKMEMETVSIINQNDITEASKESLIKINENNAVNSGLDTLLKKGEIKLNAEQVHKLKAEINRLNMQTKIDIANYKLDVKKAQYNVEQNFDEMKIKALGITIGASVEQTKATINALTNVIGTTAGGFLIGKGLTGITKTKTTQTINEPRYDTRTGNVIDRKVTTTWE